MNALRMFWFWATRQTRRLGGMKAARSRRLNKLAADTATQGQTLSEEAR